MQKHISEEEEHEPISNRPTKTQVGDYSINVWDNGGVQLEKRSFNPKTQEPVYYKIPLTDVGDALCIKKLIQDHYKI